MLNFPPRNFLRGFFFLLLLFSRHFQQSFSDADFEELMEGWKVKSAAAESGLLEWGLMTAVKEQG